MPGFRFEQVELPDESLASTPDREIGHRLSCPAACAGSRAPLLSA
jgi:hypothetical protein